jgi:hypothetical protein
LASSINLIRDSAQIWTLLGILQNCDNRYPSKQDRAAAELPSQGAGWKGACVAIMTRASAGNGPAGQARRPAMALIRATCGGGIFGQVPLAMPHFGVGPGIHSDLEHVPKRSIAFSIPACPKSWRASNSLIVSNLIMSNSIMSHSFSKFERFLFNQSISSDQEALFVFSHDLFQKPCSFV